MFDEQPDAPLHGECAAEIHRLQALNAELLAAVNAFMALDKSFATICDKHLDEMAAEGNEMAIAVKLSRAAINKAGQS